MIFGCTTSRLSGAPSISKIITKLLACTHTTGRISEGSLLSSITTHKKIVQTGNQISSFKNTMKAVSTRLNVSFIMVGRKENIIPTTTRRSLAVTTSAKRVTNVLTTTLKKSREIQFGKNQDKGKTSCIVEL